MRTRPLLALAIVALGAIVLTNLGFRKRQALRTITQWCDGTDRFVDASVRLITVKTSPKGEQILEGKPPMEILRTQEFGGTIDTKLERPELISGPSRSPRVWYASEDQEAIVLHADPQRLGQLVYGSEGAGKTRALAMWHYFQWIRVIGQGTEAGQTAPTEDRLELVLREMQDLYRPSWYRYLVGDRLLQFCDRSRIQFVSTYRKSKAQGSPIQGYNWARCGRDEAQDSIDVHEDIESRGRAARDGLYWQLATATAKDDSDWRNLRDTLIASGQWTKRELSIFRSPFIPSSFLAAKKASMTDREFRRRYGDPLTGRVEDLPPELQLYFGWDRERCLRPIPTGATKVTSIVLAKRTGNARHGLLAGHDPGSLKGATIYLDAFDVRGKAAPVWFVRGETMHRQQTTEKSAQSILVDVRTRGMNLRSDSPIVHVRAQPVGNSESKPSEDLYRIFAREGLDVRAAQYRKNGTGTGQIKKDDRIELVNWLFESGRLFVECDDMRRPCAPNLVKSLETMERDENGRAETERKDEHDLSDASAALGYALWPFEKSGASSIQRETRDELAAQRAKRGLG